MDTEFKNELQIVEQILTELIGDGFKVSASDGETSQTPSREIDSHMEHIKTLDGSAWSTGEARLFAWNGDKRAGVAWCIFGNGNDGLDVVADWSDSVDAVVSTVIDQITAKHEAA